MPPRGGAREGAGAKRKPPEEKAKRQTFALHPATLAAIKDGAERMNISQAELIRRGVTMYLAATASEPPA